MQQRPKWSSRKPVPTSLCLLIMLPKTDRISQLKLADNLICHLGRAPGVVSKNLPWRQVYRMLIIYGGYGTHTESPCPQKMQGRLEVWTQHRTSRKPPPNEEVMIVLHI